MTRPRLSVVVATHDRPALLARAIASAQAQDWDDFEILVVDDASGPETAEVLERLSAEDGRIRTLRNERSLGPAAARNRAVVEARGELIAVMDDDDVSVPHRFRSQIARLDADPDLGAVFSATRWVDGGGKELALWPGLLLRDELPDDPAAIFRWIYLEGNKLPNPTLLTRTELLRRTPFPVDQRVGEDWLLFLRWAASGVRIAALAEPLVAMRRGEDHRSLMADKRRAFADQRRVLRRIRRELAAAGDRRFDALHRSAWANQLVREARWYSGARGLALALRALAVVPSHPDARRTVGELVRRGWRKLIR